MMHNGTAIDLGHTPDPRPVGEAGVRSYVPWGMSAAIDLHGCWVESLKSAACLRVLVPALIDAIGMWAPGPLALERFGSGRRQGWSAVLFIESGTVVVHADEVGARCFVDVSSCKPFDPEIAAAVVVDHVGGTPQITVRRR